MDKDTPGNQTAANEIHAADLRCNYLRAPLGIADPRPKLTWTVTADGGEAVQTAYRIHVASSEAILGQAPDIWDSGKVMTGQATQIMYDGPPLTSGRRVHWAVRLWDEKGRPGPLSKSAWWEMGLLDEHDWEARWIAGPEPCPIFRRAFAMSQPVARARLYLCGQGVYEAWLNGHPVSDEVLGPQLSNYPVRMFYDTFDVSHLLQPGRNAVGVCVAPGWFGGERTSEPIKMPDGPRHALIAQLVLTYEDGTQEKVATDTGWKTAESGIKPVKSHWAHCYGESGERFDASCEPPTWKEADFDDGAWLHARVINPPTRALCPRMNEPNRVVETVTPVAVTPIRESLDAAEYAAMIKAAGSRNWSLETMENPVFAKGWTPAFSQSYREHQGASVSGFEVDFGKHISGWARMDVSGSAGDTVTMFGLDQHRLGGSAKEVVGQRFMHRAFRYLPVHFSGGAKRPRIENIRALSVQNDIRSVGTFECSCPALNRIHDAAARTWRVHMLSGMPMDSWRERFGTGLIENCESAFYWSDMGAFYTKWLQDHRDSQREDGYLSISGGPIAYDYWQPNTSKSGIVLVPWLMYLHYGDRQVVAENYPAMKRWLDLCAPPDDDGPTWRPPENHGVAEAGYGDHGRPSARWYDAHVGDLFETLHTIHCFRMARQMAQLLGETQDAEDYAAILARLRRKTNSCAFLDPASGLYGEGDQGCHAAAICEHVAPESLRGEVENALIDDIMTKRQGHLNTGFIGTWYLLKALVALGRPDVAITVLSNETPPSIATMLRHPDSPEELTLLPEFFYGGMIPHPGWCSVGFWFYESLAGIRPDWAIPGFRRIVIHPQPAPHVEWIKARHHSIAGEIGSEWSLRGGRLELKVIIPPNCSAQVIVPAQGHDGVKAPDRARFMGMVGSEPAFEVASGTWTFAS